MSGRKRTSVAPILGLLAVCAASSVDAPIAHADPPPAASGGPAPSAASAASYDTELMTAVRSAASKIQDAIVGIAIVDVDSGRVLAATGEHTPLNPASNAKLFTAATALATLHGDYRYQTVLAGTAKNGAVTGGLVLRGTGDPSLRSADLFALVQDLKAHGVRRVDGDIVVDQQHFDAETTPPAFEQQPNEWASFRAPVSPVAVNENTVTLTVRPATSGNPAHVSFDPPGFVDVTGTVKTSDEGADNVILALQGAGKRLSATVSGSVAESSKLVRYTRRVDDPSLLGGYALKVLLEDAGIKVSGDVKAGSPKNAHTLATHDSAPLSELLLQVGKHSDNFYAEMIFKSLGGERKGRPAKSADAAEVVTKWLAAGNMLEPGTVIKNGSGLFDANRVTAHGVTLVLRDAWNDPSRRAEMVAELAIGGVDGTLHKRFRNRAKHMAIRAKTGTLDDTIALSGYVLAPPGKSPVAFSILFNKVSGKGGAARSAADELVEKVHDKLWSHGG
mgnify:CR=1 FL=1